MTNSQLRAIRASTGLNQQDFGAPLGLSLSAIEKKERGVNPIREVDILAIKNIYKKHFTKVMN